MATILVYADSADLATWTGSTAPDNAAALLRTASMLIRQATKATTYDVDDDGAPTDQDVIDAFRDAACAHAQQMAENGVTPAAGAAGVPGPVTASGIGSGSVQFAAPANSAAVAQGLLSELCTEALMILDEADLLHQAPRGAQG